MKKFFTTMVSIFLLGFSSQASAGSFPYSIPDVGQFVNNTTYFNGVTQITAATGFNFDGKWAYTALGFESGNVNMTQSPISNIIPTFFTGDTSNFGSWVNVDFSTENIYFEDTDGPASVKLDPFNSSNSDFFEIYRLLADSELLDYLPNDITLAAGTIIVGFNDNGAWNTIGNDHDYDDIIIALRPVPEPTTIALFGIGLLGLAGIGRRKMN